MAKQRSEASLESLIGQTNDLLRTQLILQLANQGVPKHTIRQIVKCDMNLVTNILKPLKVKV